MQETQHTVVPNLAPRRRHWRTGVPRLRRHAALAVLTASLLSCSSPAQEEGDAFDPADAQKAVEAIVFTADGLPGGWWVPINIDSAEGEFTDILTKACEQVNAAIVPSDDHRSRTTAVLARAFERRSPQDLSSYKVRVTSRAVVLNSDADAHARVAALKAAFQSEAFADCLGDVVAATEESLGHRDATVRVIRVDHQTKMSYSDGYSYALVAEITVPRVRVFELRTHYLAWTSGNAFVTLSVRGEDVDSGLVNDLLHAAEKRFREAPR